MVKEKLNKNKKVEENKESYNLKDQKKKDVVPTSQNLSILINYLY